MGVTAFHWCYFCVSKSDLNATHLTRIRNNTKLATMLTCYTTMQNNIMNIKHLLLVTDAVHAIINHLHFLMAKNPVKKPLISQKYIILVK